MPLFKFDEGWHFDDPQVRFDTEAPVTSTIMADTKTTYPVEQVIGFCASTKGMLNTYKTEMIAAGVDPTALLALMDTDIADLNTQNAAQEALKTQLRNKTPIVEASKNTAYGNASKGCDMLISAFGRTSQQAQEATNLRKSLHSTHHAPTPPNP